MIDFTKVKKIHFIGIKGWGTSALAQLLALEGYEVCGSDYPEYFRTQDLLSRNPRIRIEEFSHSIQCDVDGVIYSTAYLSHPELDDAQKKHLPLSSYPEALAPFFNKKRGVAVSGTHGKTTTTAWIAYVLFSLGLDPTALVGSRMKQFSSNVLVGSSDYFVLEADEYQKKLELYSPDVAVITSIEYDHPDFFKTEEDYKEVFRSFAKRVLEKGHVIVCVADKGVADMVSSIQSSRWIRYGWDRSLEYSADVDKIDNGKTSFTLFEKGKEVGLVRMKLMGTHNILNALAVFAACRSLGVEDVKKCIEYIELFEGTARRSEYRASINNTIVLDDYAHHPTEIKTTLHTIREKYPKAHIWCVFWPHTYSRTQTLFNDFVTSFSDVDTVVLIDIYGSKRESEGTIHSMDLVDAINSASHSNARYGGDVDTAAELIKKNLSSIDVLVTMGAEDLWKKWEHLLT